MGVRPVEAAFATALLVRRLAEVASLSDYERDLIYHLKLHSHSYSADTTITDSQSECSSPNLIVSGWACRERLLSNGRRGLLSILLPGDVIGNCREKRALDMVEVTAISDVQISCLAPLMRLIEADPTRCGNIIDGLSALRFREERRLIDHMVRLGLQTAPQRTASLLLELFERCREIGFVTGGSFLMPLTQEMLGDALGMSVVHVNRVIRELRIRHLIYVHSGVVEIEDIAGLASAAGFQPNDTRHAASAHS